MTKKRINSKAKGDAGEREFAKLLREYGHNARRGQQYSGIDGEDVVGLTGFHVEVKRVERLNIHEAMNQSIRDAKDQVPIVAHRKNNTDWIITLRARDFLKIIGEKK